MQKLTQKEIMMKQRKTYIQFWIKGILLLAILIAAIDVDAQPSAKCRDQELEVACKTALEAADVLLQQKDAKAIFLESQLKMQLSQNEHLQKKILVIENKAWYDDSRLTFLLGIIAGGLSYEAIRSR